MHIAMTGGTSGFGFDTVQRLINAGHAVTVGGRSNVGTLAGAPELLIPLDLTSTPSIEAFANRLSQGPTIDALLLNAGIQLSKLEHLPNGREKTFSVNHLAHVRLLVGVLPSLRAGARVILTGSGTHDPEERTPVTPPDHADARLLAYPETDPSLPKSARKQAFRAYSSSKLANIMTARHLAKVRPDLSVIAYDPGYVPWTGLGRANGAVLSAIASLVIPRLMARDRSSTIEQSGKYLADLAVGPNYADAHGDYYSVRTPDLVCKQPSALARDHRAAEALWRDSLALLELADSGASARV